MYTVRQARQDLNTKAERMISDAIDEVEDMGCDEVLTDVVVTLGEAKEKLGEYIDAQLIEALRV